MRAEPSAAEPAAGTSPLAFTIALGAFIVLATTVVWAAVGGGYFWPCWVILGCGAALAPLIWWNHLHGRPNTAHTRVWWHLDVSATAAAVLMLVWLFTGAHGLWAFWSILGLALALGLHALIDLRAEVPQLQTRALQERVDTLSRTRRQAVDAQAAELRRIERDLHDGAQARLVALTMQLGRAEAELAHEPAAAALVRAAREEATVAIQELRDLARGIAPPVLADRGLVAAVQSLADRGHAALTVTTANDGRRLPPAVENAAYFLIAEALTNAAKHAPGVTARVDLALRPKQLVVDVTDDGPGGADVTGNGLQGLRARVEALDGTLAVTSPEGGPTHLHAELPCE
ncbi:sensor histidine kinase [Jatrophihabitans sp. GAS493]|uniref:sensor histidine kinase n=1 Tax=Jatrophihabitans sp. GAS493 TaxID=1907575 RepID=UPI000BB82D0E|nr:histidine kinase [Jatrophihabitans sp. GAS493]